VRAPGQDKVVATFAGMFTGERVTV
jgi:hypothetical protein